MTKKRFTRWLFYDPSSPDESAFHQSLSEKIDAWWRAFVDRCDDIDALFRQGTDWDLPKWMEQHLQCIHPRLMWEYGPAVRTNGHRLVITPEAARHLRPLTNTILERAPQLTGWEFYAYRLPENLEKAQLTVEARTGGTIQDLLFQSRTGKDHRIDLAFYSPRTSAQDDPQALNDAFVAVESLLGEERLDRWIGAIEVALLGADQRKSRLLPLSQLHERVGALVGQVIDQQPSEPFFKRIETLEWTMYRLEPDEAEDYPTQSDIFVAKSVHPALWSAAHCGTSFCSERFSKCGELFCYIKLDGAQGLDEEKFADKSEIEDALDAVLRPEGLGCHIGGGTGLRYSYLDLALTDLNRGLAAVRNRLQQGNVPRRSWILFFDADLAGEWIGVYDDTPPPPMADPSATLHS